MLEILAIIWLCNKNKANALARGRKPGGFTALTVALWFGMEFIGVILGFVIGMEIGAYIFGLGFAIVGGVISFQVAKKCKPGDYVAPAVAAVENAARSAQPLTAPARVDIVRESSFVGAVVSWSFTLNGQFVGSLSNGKAMTAYTNQSSNVLVATDAYGTSLSPFVFDAQSGGFVELHFKANRFLPEKSRGLMAPGIPQPAPYAPQPAPVSPQSVEAAPQPAPAPGTVFCSNCGTALSEDAQFCNQCGARR